MTDLRAELNCNHSGEDGRTTIEHQRERRHNLHNDFGTPIATATGCPMQSPGCLGAVGGCMALAPHLQMVVWLHKF
jgi:hypothetical protein